MGRHAHRQSAAHARGMTLIELLIALALTALMMSAIGSLLALTSTSAARTAGQLDLQAQARFAARRIAQRIADTPVADLPAKSDPSGSGTWLAPAVYQFVAADTSGAARITETISGTTRVIAEPVIAFSITSVPALGTPVVVVALTLARDDSRASATVSTRLGSAL